MEERYYVKALANDIREWAKDNEFDYADQWKLGDALWTEDSITGNGSGSYTMNRSEAREIVLAHLDEVLAVYEDFGRLDELGKMMSDGEWEKIDVFARCHYLAEAIDRIWDELNSAKKKYKYPTWKAWFEKNYPNGDGIAPCPKHFGPVECDNLFSCYWCRNEREFPESLIDIFNVKPINEEN